MAVNRTPILKRCRSLGIEPAIDSSSNTINQYYSIGGIRIQKPSVGLFIVKTKNGKMRKVIK